MHFGDQEYFISNTICKGTEGNVFTAIDRKNNKALAIKIIVLTNKEQKIKFENHIQLINRLSNIDHPYICKLLHCNTSKIIQKNNNQKSIEIGYTSMKLYDRDLFSYAVNTKLGFLSEIKAKQIFKKICLGLNALHAANIAHLDLKPENILMEMDNPYICDFGSSVLIHKSVSSPFHCFSKGTNEYFPPELFSEDEISTRYSFNPKKRDIFSLGVLLHVILCGFFPYDVNDHFRTVNIDTDIISSNGVHLLSWMLQRDPIKRPTIEEIFSHTWMLTN